MSDRPGRDDDRRPGDEATTSALAHDLGGDPSEPFTRRSAAYTSRRLLRRARRLLGDSPTLVPVVLWATPGSAKRAVTADTVAVIEGFPRSGNTFAYFALQEAQPGPVQVSSHVHVPAQVAQAVRMGKPTLVVVREPVACLASLLTAAPHVRIGPAYDEYTHHHRQVLRWADHIVVGTFEQVTTDFGSVIVAVNARFGTAFAPFIPTPTNVERVFTRIDVHYRELYGDKASERVVPRPSEARRAEKDWLTTQLTTPRHAARRAEAEAVYAELASLAVRPPST